ncbi:receptor-like protein EIX2 [Abrus precatorius]|uniref:Receptor-like protein EIX2 n=1 Tax=Abrus precatorius TaxID=3816 RepID=A0A8B8LRC8_ABRPR|nr:receptor-like protein EIX2 [Abrus precatorius]
MSAEIKCIESERQALLNFKHSISHDFGMLSTWSDDDSNRDCCKWKGIQCHNETGHVHMLDLRGDQHTQYLTGAFNITSLVHLQNMEYLDLSDNYFLWSDIPEVIGSFTNLRYLDISYSYFAGRIPCELGKLAHLQYLGLGNNFLDGEIPYHLGNLSRLKYLDLNGNSNSFFGAIPFQVGNLTNLHTLGIGGNFDVESKDAQWLSNLHSLTILELSSLPNLGSSHWLQTIAKLIPNLTELRLVDCTLSDTDIQSLFYSHSKFSTSLTILDLSSNMLTSSTLQLLSNFSHNLQELYLSRNNIVLSSPLFPNFPSLVILYLPYNNITSVVFQGIFKFSPKLESLYFLNCSLTDESFLMSYASTMNSSSSLVTVDLSSNLLKSSSIFYWLFNFTTNLRTLCLRDNLLENPIPDEFGKAFNSLEYLDLSYNKLGGEIPSFFGNICTLQTLDLSYNKNNRITGVIPESIRLLSELEFLYLGGNSLEGDVTESHLSNFSKLRGLFLSYNSVSLKLSSWVPPSQLSYLFVASCKLGPSFPGWLRTSTSLNFLDISDNGLNGFVPEWFWNNLQYISNLNMSHNNLTGVIPNFQLKLPLRPYIHLESNQFEGNVPLFLLQASALILSENKFSDSFSFLCDRSTATNLAILDLSNNQMKGQLPDCWESARSLLFLDLSNNVVSGKIPMSMGTLIQLKALVLRNNNLTGELPFTLKNCGNLVMMDVGENMLSGPIPSWIGESLLQLIILSLRGNLSNYYELYITWMWKGVEQRFTDPELILRSIDLSCNNLTGEIPKEVGYLVGLVSLNLSRNNLCGEIPSGLGNLSSLESLDLSRNHLFGRIPSSLSQIDSLGKLNLSHNSLSGRIPSGRHMQTFDASSFEGNVDLCGEQLNKSCPGDVTIVKPQEATTAGEDSTFYEGLYMSLGLGYFVGFWGLLGTILLWQPWRNAYMRFLNTFTDYIHVMIVVNMAKWRK